MERSYAPPFGSAKYIINYAGFVAGNVISGDVRIFHTEEAMNPEAGTAVRDTGERTLK